MRDREPPAHADVAELAAHLARWDGDGDGWLTRVEYERFGEREDAPLIRQQLVAGVPDELGSGIQLET